MSVESITAFSGISVFAVLLGILIPDNGCRNSLNILIGLAVAATLFSVITDIELTRDIGVIIEESENKIPESITYDAASDIISKLTEAEIVELVKEFTGKDPRSVTCEIIWSSGEFVLSSVLIKCECDNPLGVIKFVAAKMDIDVEIIKVIAEKNN